MLGLTALEHELHPLTTLDKLLFLLENAYAHTHALTALISFGALGVLGVLRAAKVGAGKLGSGGRWVVGVRAVPEVLVVVLGATGKQGVCFFPTLSLLGIMRIYVLLISIDTQHCTK